MPPDHMSDIKYFQELFKETLNTSTEATEDSLKKAREILETSIQATQTREKFWRTTLIILLATILIISIGLAFFTSLHTTEIPNGNFIQNFLLNLGTEVAGALLIFILIDTFWTKIKTDQQKSREVDFQYLKIINKLEIAAVLLNQMEEVGEALDNPSLPPDYREELVVRFNKLKAHYVDRIKEVTSAHYELARNQGREDLAMKATYAMITELEKQQHKD